MTHLAYIGPGSGFALAQSFLTIVLSIIAGLAFSSALRFWTSRGWCSARRAN